MAKQWHVYLVRRKVGALYTGVATDVSRRFAEHMQGEGKAAKYLRGRGPLQLVFEKAIGNRALALRVEAWIKRLPKVRKEELVRRNDSAERLVAQARERPPS